eukprot:TRINITY_DN268_c0_g1_i2.p1 TRINITY_DN268_c0_g1~~TRINITY_DN268_c0_g1_i2.p1  ORF type:complete len:105 (-),score=8.04 TRINITY_DN268_c0_g1_i2:2-316(-)
MVSGTISPPFSGYFSSFPHGTCSLSVSNEYLALPDGAGRFRRNFSGSALLRIPLPITTYLYRTITLYGQSFQTVLVHCFMDIVVPHVLCVDTGRSSETAKAHRG